MQNLCNNKSIHNSAVETKSYNFLSRSHIKLSLSLFHSVALQTVTMTLPFIHPFCLTVAGPSQSGKSTFVSTLLENVTVMIEPKIVKVLFCYSLWQPNYKLLQTNNRHIQIDFHEGLFDADEISLPPQTLVVLDDLMEKVNTDVVDLFTKHSHHRSMSVIFITQNIFQQNKHSRTMNLNTNYIVLFKNPRDMTQIEVLGRQMYGKKWKAFTNAYKMATELAHGYLLIDLKQQTPDRLRLRTDIFPPKETVVFVI